MAYRGGGGAGYNLLDLLLVSMVRVRSVGHSVRTLARAIVHVVVGATTRARLGLGCADANTAMVRETEAARPDNQGLPESRARWHRHQHTIPAAAVRGIALAPSLPCVRCPQRHSRTGLAMLWLHGRARGLLRHLAGGEASTATSGDTFVLCHDRARSCRSLGFRPRFLCQARTKTEGGWVDAPGGRPTTQDYPHE